MRYAPQRLSIVECHDRKAINYAIYELLAYLVALTFNHQAQRLPVNENFFSQIICLIAKRLKQ